MMETGALQKKEQLLNLPLTWCHKQGPRCQKTKSTRQRIPCVSEMIKQLPREKINEITKCFQDWCVELEDAPGSWRIVKLVFLRKPGATLRKGTRSFRSTALTSVMWKWYATCVVLRLEEELDGWKQLHVE